MTRKSRKAMPIAQRWRWHGSWWPTSWRSTVGSGIFRWWRRITVSLRRACGEQGRISSARRLPGLAVNPTGRRSASSGCSRWLVSRLAGKHKLNLLFKTTRWSETANGSLVLSKIGTTAERPTHAARNQEYETRTSALRPDNVICDAGGDVRVCRVWMLRQQFLRISVSFFHLLEAGEMPFLQNRFHIRFHSGGKRQRKKGFSIVGICFLALPGKFAGASESIAKMAHAPRIRAAVNPTQEFLFVQEKIAGQYALAG